MRTVPTAAGFIVRGAVADDTTLATLSSMRRTAAERRLEMIEPGRVLPPDQYNERLVGNVHPTDWQNPQPSGRYNLVVIGAGTAGLVTAAGAAGLGAKVALVERHLMGGDCLNVGCVPSKCIIRSSRVVGDLRDLARFGAKGPVDVEIDFPAVMERMRRLRAQISDNDSVWRFRDEKGVDVFLGDARFKDAGSVEVDGRTLRFKRAVITTGARPTRPPIPGLDDVGYLTNENVFELTQRPRRLAVIGAGPIGCELAQAFRRLGSEVALLDMAENILGREDGDAAAIVQRALIGDGVRLLLSSRIESVRREGGDKVLRVVCGGIQQELHVDEILVGIGRTPNVDGLNLEAVGVHYDRKDGVQVNDHLQTTNPRIYAAGDVCMQYKFTHMADAAARIVIQNALFFGKRKLSALHVPWCTYTDPEVAHVGLYERDAAARGIEVDTYVRPFDEVDRAVTDGEEDGFAKIIVKKGTDQILGATIVARHAGEMISEITLAMVGAVGLGKIAGVIHPYPTQAEAIRQLGDAYNRTRLTPLVKRLFQLWLAWTR
jgi:pyruvate/2-oxoglutarate dehydrogenase complex dihydrolipoamide dehydrogenase (E3) component